MLLLAAGVAVGVAVATTEAGRAVVGFNVIMGAHDANDPRGGRYRPAGSQSRLVRFQRPT